MAYRASAILPGHGNDVRAVAFPHPSFALSTSRDGTARRWDRVSSAQCSFDSTVIALHRSYVISVTYVPPSAEYPNGLIVTGGEDKVIQVRQPSVDATEDAEALLVGHDRSVCSLSTTEDGRFIISASWDGSVMAWRVGQWGSPKLLQEKQWVETSQPGKFNGVPTWAAIPYDNETVVTASVDGWIRIIHINGNQIRKFANSYDKDPIIRALCKLPEGHPSGAHFASAGHDTAINLWTLDGRRVLSLRGHEDVIYSLGILPDGRIVSSSEDKMLKVWKGTQCEQSIHHPVLSVWSIAVCAGNGDIITGANDGVVRIFSSSPGRQDPQAIQELKDSFKGWKTTSALHSECKEEQPNVLTKRMGAFEGEPLRVKENDQSVSAYRWSTADNEWCFVGTLEDHQGKELYEGKWYDHVWKVAVGAEDNPSLTLPYNIEDEPSDVAKEWVEKHKLHPTYVETIAKYIIANRKKPLEDEDEDFDEDSEEDAEASAEEDDSEDFVEDDDRASGLEPKATYTYKYDTSKIPLLGTKLTEHNDALFASDKKDKTIGALMGIEGDILPFLQEVLWQYLNRKLDQQSVDLAVKITTKWPHDKRVPGIDLLRTAAAISPILVSHTSTAGQNLITMLKQAKIFTPASPTPNVMLATYTLANLFQSPEGCALVRKEFTRIHKLLQSQVYSIASKANQNHAAAMMILYLNYTVLFLELGDSKHALPVLEAVSTMLSQVLPMLNRHAMWVQTLLHGLEAIHTLLSIKSKKIRKACGTLEIGTLMKEIESKVRGHEKAVSLARSARQALERWGV